MLMLYSFLIIMALVAIGIISIPFLKNSTLKSKNAILISLFILCFSFIVYQFSGNKSALKKWITQGKQHYQLQNQVIELGGIDAIIENIKQKLKDNPDDAKGWFILGKLYYSQHNYEAAKVVLKKAHELEPDNVEIMRYYDSAMNK